MGDRNLSNNNEKSLSAGQKIWLILTLLGMGISFWMFSVINKVWKENLTKEVRVEELVTRINDIEGLGIEKQIVSERFGELSEFFLEGETGVAMVAESIEQIANQTGMSLILSFEDFEEKVDIGGVYQLGLGIYMEVHGTYQGLLNFTKKIEELPYFMKFSEVKVNSAKLVSGIKAEFKGVIFLK